MHEIGMLRQTAELATRFAEENGIDAVKNITIEIGELSGALPEVFTEYFPFIAEQYPRVRGGERLCVQRQRMARPQNISSAIRSASISIWSNMRMSAA